MKKFNFKPISGFSAIAYKRKVQEKIYQETKDMTSEQFMEYVHREAHKSEIWRRFEKKPATR